MSIKQWPKNERPRERLLMAGASALSDAELLAIFLRTGSKGNSVMELSRKLLHKFGSLKSIMNASQSEFCQFPGLGSTKYVQLQAIMELAQRHINSKLRERDIISCPADTVRYLQMQLSSYQHEVFGCLFLDNRNRVVAYEELFRGTINGANVHPREVVKCSLQHNAAAVIFAHNHPSGEAEPSQADIDVTLQLKKCLALVDIRVLDHLIIGQGVSSSLAELGKL